MKHYHVAQATANTPTEYEVQPYFSRIRAERRLKNARNFAISVGWTCTQGNARKGYYLKAPENSAIYQDEAVHIFLCIRPNCNGNPHEGTDEWMRMIQWYHGHNWF